MSRGRQPRRAHKPNRRATLLGSPASGSQACVVCGACPATQEVMRAHTSVPGPLGLAERPLPESFRLGVAHVSCDAPFIVRHAWLQTRTAGQGTVGWREMLKYHREW